MNKAEFKGKINAGLSSASDVRHVIDGVINDLLNGENDTVYITATLKRYLRYIVEIGNERKANYRKLSQKQIVQVAESDEEFERRKLYEQHKVNKLKARIANSLDVLRFAYEYLRLKIQQVGNMVEKKEAEKQESKAIKELSAKVDKKVFSRKEACMYLSINDRKLGVLVRSNKIKPIDIAAKPYTFHRAELDRYIEDRPREDFLTTPKPTKKKTK